MHTAAWANLVDLSASIANSPGDYELVAATSWSIASASPAIGGFRLNKPGLGFVCIPGWASNIMELISGPYTCRYRKSLLLAYRKAELSVLSGAMWVWFGLNGTESVFGARGLYKAVGERVEDGGLSYEPMKRA